MRGFQRPSTSGPLAACAISMDVTVMNFSQRTSMDGSGQPTKPDFSQPIATIAGRTLAGKLKQEQNIRKDAKTGCALLDSACGCCKKHVRYAYFSDKGRRLPFPSALVADNCNVYNKKNEKG